jgi:hypothetical protein
MRRTERIQLLLAEIEIERKAKEPLAAKLRELGLDPRAIALK